MTIIRTTFLMLPLLSLRLPVHIDHQAHTNEDHKRSDTFPQLAHLGLLAVEVESDVDVLWDGHGLQDLRLAEQKTVGERGTLE
jgi:hypothetical protein